VNQGHLNRKATLWEWLFLSLWGQAERGNGAGSPVKSVGLIPILRCRKGGDMRILKPFAFLILAVLIAAPVSAASLSSVMCGSHIIKLGDSQLDVQEKCGSPSYTVGDSWVYEDTYGANIVIHFGGASVFDPRVIRIEEVEELPGDQP